MTRRGPEWEQRAPDLVEPIIGFRKWVYAGGRLHPWGNGEDVWNGAHEVRATCASKLGGFKDHSAPGQDCHCGFNAFHEPPHEGTYLRSIRNLHSPVRECVIGAMVCRGAVEVHTQGFRAEYARPVLLAWSAEIKLHVMVEAVPVDVQVGVAFKRGRETRIPSDRERVEGIAAGLGLRAVCYGDLMAEALAFGSPIPPDLRPPLFDIGPEGRRRPGRSNHG